jgi:nucleotide-binding universal stress UspA family protein
MTVLVGVDRSNNSEPPLEEGARLATELGEDLEVVHVLSRSEFVDLERTSVSETSETLDIDEVRSVAANIARKIAEDVVDDFEATGLVGDAASEVVRLGKKRNARYLVIGIRKRSAVGKAVFGSTAQDILMSTDRPVISVPREKIDE